MKQFDVVIVGNGILGLTLAYFLKKKDPNISIALIGKDERVGCASLVAGAMLNLWAEITDQQFENTALTERFKLTKGGFDAWSEFAREISELSGNQIDLKWGTYIIRTLRSTQVEEKTIEYIKKSLQRFDVAHKELKAQDIPWLKPSQSGRLIDALWVPDGHVDSRKVIGSLDAILPKLGIHTFNQNAHQLRIGKSSTSHQVILEDQTRVEGPQVILANGAFAQQLIDQNESLRSSMPRLLFGIGSGIDITVPGWIYEYGGLGKEILDLQEVIRTTDRGGACGVHLIPYGNGKFFAGASSLTSLDCDLEPKLHGVHVLLHALVNEIHKSFFNMGIRLRGNGFRPTSADCFPMIGETNHEGIWLLNGTKRDGFTMAPYISNELASAILKKPTNLPKLFLPSRSLISYKTKEIALKDAELMYIGADYQHGAMQVPYMEERYNNMRKQDIERVYEKRNIHNFGIHPEIIHLYDNDNFYNQINHTREQSGSKTSFMSDVLSLIKNKVSFSR